MSLRPIRPLVPKRAPGGVRRWLAAAVGVAALAWSCAVLAHSVGQVQTTKFFAPETTQLLVDRINGGGPAGFQVGDILTYIIQFTPVANGATTGVAGYVTDYIPPGVEVVGADFVTKVGDSYVPVAPSLPGGIDSGWGNRGARTFLAPFNTNAYDPTGRCAAGGFTNNCNGRLTELHADTGIFYSTDPRTEVFPQLPTRIAQGTNGYNINPTASGQLNPIIGQTAATTHNLWDADQTNAFGSTAAAVAALAAPKSAAGALSDGRGPAPYLAGSPVAGPQTGYPLDNTAQVGPWKRIYYPGSRIGDPTNGPATAADLSFTAVGGLPTSLGYHLSESNPLPPGTNAVRWAVGKLVVGQINYVRIKLRITQPVASEGITNASEVFGGDAGDGDNGQDNPWRYHVPSVADNNSNLYISKIPCVYNAAATSCTPLSGAYHAGNTTITYQITYLNTGNQTQNNVVLRDYLPCQTTVAATGVYVGTVTGPLSTVMTAPYSTTTTANGNCTAPQTRHTVTFPTIPSVGPGAGGKMIINIRNTATTINDDVVNTARLSSASLPNGVSSNAVTFVGNAANPALAISKSTPTPTSTAGGTAQYVIVVQNTGTGTATHVVINDILPSNGTPAVDPTTRFNFGTVTALASSGLVTTTALATATTTAALGGLTPYNTAPGAANRVQINFDFGAASTLAPGGVITLTFNVNVGSAINASVTPYYNNSVASGTSSASVVYRVDSGDSAPVTISGALQVSKALECYYYLGSCVTPGPGNAIPANARVRWRVDYANTGGGALSNVVLTDSLPCQISSTAASVTVTSVISGPIAPTSTTPYLVPGPFTGNCPGTRGSFSFPSTTLNAGQTGALQIEAQLTTPAGTSSVVNNDVTLSATGTGSAQANAQANVSTQAVLLITKSATPAAVQPGGTLSYTVTVTNVGTTAAQTITLYDILPTGTSTLADTTRRFNYVTGTSVITGSLTSTGPTTQTPPTISPYSSGPYAANQVQMVWTFPGQVLAVGSSAQFTFTAQAGSNLPALAPPNYYNNRAVVTYHNAQQATSNAAAASVSLVANLGVTKTNGTTTLLSGATTTYTITISNGGPSAADGAVVKDVPSAGLNCTHVTCSGTTGSATCPTSMLPQGTAVAIGSTTLLSTGEAIPALPAGSTVTLLLRCTVTASGS